MSARTLFRLVLVLLVALGAVACGGDDDDSAGDDAATSSESGDGGSSEGEWPVTIEHAYGETTIDARPERIVSMNVQWTDVLVSLGVTPAGYVLDQTSGESEIYPWQEGVLDGATEITMTSGPPLEQIAALDPDLILVTYIAADQGIYDSLSEVAPTIPQLSPGAAVDPWQDMTAAAGRFLGESERAEEVVAEVEGGITDTAEGLPQLAGKSFVMVNYLPGDSLTVVADPEDGSSVFFQLLGMELLPSVVEEAAGAEGRIELSLERVGMLDADLLAILPNDGDPGELPGYDDLPSVAAGCEAEMDFQDAVALNTPTPLSLPYVTDLLLPSLECVAGA
jgi:iron complex transport system substrate-binding protein